MLPRNRITFPKLGKWRYFSTLPRCLNKIDCSKPKTYTNLSQILEFAIKTTGPIPVSSYMKQCLVHPEFGYYTTRDPLSPISETSDFVTSPEISQTFGEMIGIYHYTTWLLQGKPKEVRFIEFGPGKGTLIFDCIRTFERLSKGTVLYEVILVEASPILREEQRKKLCGDTSLNVLEDGTWEAETLAGKRCHWVETELDIKKTGTNYIIAHEFFDALPVQQYEKTKDGWREYMVDFSEKNVIRAKTDPLALPNRTTITSKELENPALRFNFHSVLSPHETPGSYIPKNNPRYEALPVGSRIEICPEAHTYSKHIAALINSGCGAGGCLIIDYGPADTVPINTIRGIKNHKIVSPFDDPGNVDLSADVDFGQLKQIFENQSCQVHGPVAQGDWLHELGLGFRTDQLVHIAKSENDKQKIIKAYKRLVGKSHGDMGSIYKFLAVLPNGSQIQPVGFGGSL
ncbi:Hypothetical protein PP7435_CHR2-0245 [Komagataella phaffii CBS 7435]|uniref:Protein arginine methyltransferase NDUFAF7 n=2 Tax=Komagataella phaffii TaxID=460519 RepID=C4R2F9_KOMPG|nr:Hypothetical protein PAS_chr2-2_0233 [Komagataella phaffii GS115]AOA62923.1 GQ67_01102T0 [Komagataella phaffii]CAH2447764.1 Hypothetical protein BQ9382_C2-1345 [Komagataella phaffii CBS 7435]AOA67127.1 GQ68_00287T0 [Komagataella phaffii GS115]CAY69683.1 Hypothetical protein PAS_chr2-2_0233 [Komagataella phaffii GS115]SCV11990.1 Hypothetical protein PP7435_CHR2-0245 [Komagataella phaffii CBS 7435]